MNRLNVLADADGVTVTSITPGDPVAYAVPVPNAPGQKVDAWTSSAITPADFVAIPMSIKVTGTAKQARTFLGQLQKDSRLFLVNGFTMTKDSSDDEFSATVSGSIYALKSSS